MPCAKDQKPTWLEKARFISHYAVDGCSTTLRVYVETGIQADTQLVLGIVNTSPKDFVRFLLRPKGARTERHGIRSLKTNEAAAEDETIVDTAKLAADTIHEVTGWHVPTWGVLGDALFEIANPIIRSAYYLLLANVVEDFAFDWYSGILLSPDSKCTLGRFGYQAFRAEEPRHPFENISPAFRLFPPIGVYQDGEGLHLSAGTWVVIFTFACGIDGFPQSPGDLFFRMVTDVALELPCGKSVKVDYTGTGDTKTVKMVRKVVGPEWIALQASFHAENPGTFRGDIVATIEGFRI